MMDSKSNIKIKIYISVEFRKDSYNHLSTEARKSDFQITYQDYVKKSTKHYHLQRRLRA